MARFFNLPDFLSRAIIACRRRKKILQMQAFVRKQITGTVEVNEYRMSNKEFRMTKFNWFNSLLRRSTFAVLHSAVRF
jgi:hypothetical protein